jgi:hypothetical protein
MFKLLVGSICTSAYTLRTSFSAVIFSQEEQEKELT